MITLVTGGSGSGKSAYAEWLMMQSPCCRRYYVATMIAYGQEGRDKVRRHRELRRGKGFITLEKHCNVGSLILDQSCAVLLECVSNLAANEMFGSDTENDRTLATDCLADRIADDIRCLSGQARDMVIVTNEVGRDGIVYERETMEYIKLMGLLNQRLSHMSDRVVEVVCGIPVVLKPCSPVCERRIRLVEQESARRNDIALSVSAE